MSNGHAPKGGIIGVNGEFYEGGKFLPSTARPKGEPKPVKKYDGPRKEQIARYEYAERPAGMRSIYAAIVGTSAIDRNGRLEWYTDYFGDSFGGIKIDDLMARYNAGERWFPR